MAQRTCSIEGCTRAAKARSWCNTHYERWRKHGTTDDPAAQSTGDRLISKVLVTPEGCWEWQGYRTTRGYGYMSVDGRDTGTHRIAYELIVGPIPQGLHLDHLCLNPPCCNPAHLEPVTPGENIRRTYPGIRTQVRALGQTHCKWGHPYDDANTYWRRDRPGHRNCKACARERPRRKAG